MPRVLIFHPALAPYRVDMFNALGAYFELRVVFLRENLLNQKFDQEALRDRLTVEYGVLTRGITYRGQSFRFGVAREIREFSPDVVITPEYSGVTLWVTLHRSFSSYAYSHVVWSDDNPSSLTKDSIARRAIRKLVLPRIQGLVLVSEEAKEYYSHAYGCESLIATVPIIQEESNFSGLLNDAREDAFKLVAKYHLTGMKVILFVGRLAPEKRIERLIEAFADVSCADSDAILVLVGDGSERYVLELLCIDLGVESKVLFMGRKEHQALSAWYRIGRVFALTSDFEPFGAVVNEALLAGMPVVCSSKAGARTLIRSGENGFVVDPGNAAALRAAIMQILDNSDPITHKSIEIERVSLMPIKFKHSVEQYTGLIEQLVGDGRP